MTIPPRRKALTRIARQRRLRAGSNYGRGNAIRLAGRKPLLVTATFHRKRQAGRGHRERQPDPIALPPAANDGSTRYGIEIGVVAKQDGLRPLWREFLTNHSALVAGLQPRRVLAPDKKWRLIAGPFANAAEAAQACALFKKASRACGAHGLCRRRALDLARDYMRNASLPGLSRRSIPLAFPCWIESTAWVRIKSGRASLLSCLRTTSRNRRALLALPNAPRA